MNPTALERIAAWFDQRDKELRAQRGTVVHDTPFGIFGSTSVADAFALCEKLDLHDGMRFCDLGSGDGRVAIVAALFCESTGVEGDAGLHAIALRAKAELLPHIPQLARCALRNADYTTIDLSEFDVLFAFADHAWPQELERSLLAREKPGILVAHQDIFRPKLRKGPTIWVGQTPFVTYPLG